MDQAPFTDVRVRRAFNMAIDRYEMRNTLAQGGGVLNSPLQPGFKSGWGLSEDDLKRLPGWRQPKDLDIEEGKRLLAEAGYPNGFRTTIKYDQTNSFLPYMTEVSLGMLRKVGIQATGIPEETGLASKTIAEGLFEVVADRGLNEAPTPNSTLRNRWRSSGRDAKAAAIGDPKLDDLIDRQNRQSTEFNEKRRQELLIEMDRLMVEQVYFVPTISGSYFGAWQPYIMNFYPGFSGQPTISKGEDMWIDLERAPAERRVR
jgi:peptide/nickel transport system substrate-binding protein